MSTAQVWWPSPRSSNGRQRAVPMSATARELLALDIGAASPAYAVPETRPHRGRATDRRCSPAGSCRCHGVAADSLGPFAMWTAFPSSDYYGPSVPSRDHQPTAGLPVAALEGRREGRSRVVPTFTTHRLTGLATSYSPAASPRVRRRHSSWPHHRRTTPASESPPANLCSRRALLPGPYPPDRSRLPP